MKRFLALLCSLALICALTGCSRIERHPTRPEPEQQAGEKEIIETVYLGSVLPYSSTSAGKSARLFAAQQTAVEIINGVHDLEDWDLALNPGLANYGKAKIALIEGDSTPAKASITKREAATSAVKELLDLGVSGLLGAYAPEDTLYVAARARLNKTPLLAGSVSSAAFSDGKTYLFDEWANFLAPTALTQTDAFFSYLKHLNQTTGAGLHRIAFLAAADEYEEETRSAFLSAAERYGFEVVLDTTYPAGAEGVANEVALVLAAAPDAVFHSGSAHELSLFINAYHAGLFTPAAAFVYGSAFQDAAFLSAARATEENYWCGYSVCPVLPQDESAWLESGQRVFSYINALYREKTNTDMDNDALLEFAAVCVLAQAIDAAGTTDAAALAAVLRSETFAAPYFPAGSIAFDANGRNSTPPGALVRVLGSGLVDAYE